MIRDPRSYIQELADSVQGHLRALRAENVAWRNLVTTMGTSHTDMEAQLVALHERLAGNGGPGPGTIEEQDFLERVARLRGAIEEHRREQLALEARVHELEKRSKKLSDHCSDVEEQNAVITNFYIALDRLHGTLARSEVIAGLVDVVVNIIGSELFALFELADEGKKLTFAGGFGVSSGDFSDAAIAAGPVATAVETRAPVMIRPDDSAGSFCGHHVLAVIPLVSESRTVAVIVIFELLAHKPALTAADRELFGVLSGHGGTALVASGLRAADLASAGRVRAVGAR